MILAMEGGRVRTRSATKGNCLLPLQMHKARAAGVSASSFLDLKAELSKHESELAKSKASGKAKYVAGNVKHPDKKPTTWARKNKGVASRAARDIELEEVGRPTIEHARAALERKAKIYEKLRKGKTGGLNDKQYDHLLVDFDQRAADYSSASESEDEGESSTAPKAIDDERAKNDPMVEYEDEFGRIRTSRRSEVPRDLAPPAAEEEDPEFDPYVIHNPQNHFPVFEPSEERVASIAEAASESANPLETHYDATREVRAKGAAFYTFSGDEETRKRQMDELRAARDETGRTRQDLGAVDVKPGEIEGMVAPLQEGHTEAETTVRSRAMEKRKRELEERRKLLDAKRRKVNTKVNSDVASTDGPSKMQAGSVSEGSRDPFATLEDQVGHAAARTSQSKGKNPTSTATLSAADDFLAQLERDIVRKTTS
ncbi:hypothetical protein BD410DRAFT_595768 [Rickenella mellea]|uniref:Coiled-coil domain-containing protein 174 n=1 Tax=Rickenella mellea TaxID=50990 RepID=A0A4Y7QCU1_9AGAM|nr:hypothetical protein BD410DRAFT_595768 [Rickenella mellea]